MLDGKVDFLIAGAQKSGTTVLYSYLKKHPNLCMGNGKELHFFDREHHFQSDTVDYSPYHQAFTPDENALLFGEATPIYLYWEPAAKRICDYNPEMKFIIILRNPIDRAYSQWNMEFQRNKEDRPFFEAVLDREERYKSALPLQHRVYSYIDRGYYSRQLERLYSFFPGKNILVLRYDDLQKQPGQLFDRIFDFLGVDRIRFDTVDYVFSTPYKYQMTQFERSYLIGLFKEEIYMLEKMLGWDCSEWFVNADG